MNPAKRVLELAQQVKIPVAVIVEEILEGLPHSTLYYWSDRGADTIPAPWQKVLNDLADTLEYYRDHGVLQPNRTNYIWQGLLHLTECIKVDPHE